MLRRQHPPSHGVRPRRFLLAESSKSRPKPQREARHGSRECKREGLRERSRPKPDNHDKVHIPWGYQKPVLAGKSKRLGPFARVSLLFLVHTRLHRLSGPLTHSWATAVDAPVSIRAMAPIEKGRFIVGLPFERRNKLRKRE